MRVAITGASGFIGNRIVEVFHLGGVHTVVPLVRSNASLALPARFDLQWKVCDHRNVNDLSRAFQHCDMVVHAAYGTPVAKMARAVYLAADRAGVKRVVVLSSASIYNQNPFPGITEGSPVPRNSATSYNAAKIRADRAVRSLRRHGATEIVFLMPGVVYGPRSQWIARVAKHTAEKTAYLVEGGGGICNGVYVDNLVEAVRLALETGDIDGESFFVSDAETVTWRDFYAPIVSAIGGNLAEVACIPAPAQMVEPLRERIRDRLQSVVDTGTVQRLKPLVPRAAVALYKAAFKFALTQRDDVINPFARRDSMTPAVSLDMSLLQLCTYKLPNTKAEQLLGYRPPVSFDEGMRRSVAWLRFAGYRVV